ncbi:hypothetical protein, partial [Hydrogenophaga sp.]
NAHEISVALELHGDDMEREVANELNRVSAEIVRRMRDLAPKWRSNLVNSIDRRPDGPLAWTVRPGVEHGLYREKGQRPGKHLPRFFDPAAKPIVDWLASKAFTGLARVRKGTGRFTARELELRDRYMGLSWHVKRKGLRAQPFAEPVALVMERTFPLRMTEFVERLVREANAGRSAGPA